MKKASQTREYLLRRAQTIAAREGLARLTLGTLAEDTGMSKSGVYARFGSITHLRVEVLQTSWSQFAEATIGAARQAPAGLRRLEQLFANCVQQVAARHCACSLYLAPAPAYGEDLQPVHDALAAGIRALRAAIAECVYDALRQGELRGDDQAEFVASQSFALLLLLRHDLHLLGLLDAAPRAIASWRHMLQTYAIAGTGSPVRSTASSPVARSGGSNRSGVERWAAFCSQWQRY